MKAHNRKINPGDCYGELTVIEPCKVLGKRNHWKCICSCKTECYRTSTSLLRTKYPSCGCKLNIKNTLPQKLSLKNAIFLAYKTNASIRKLVFELTKEQVFAMLQNPCFYCGQLNVNCTTTRKRKGRKPRPERDQELRYNGIDRVDNKKGYTVDNTVTCCKICNVAKNDLSLEDWKIWLEKAYRWTFNDQPKGVEPSGSKRETPLSVDEDMV